MTLHEILFTMVSSLTKKSEGEVLDILYKRVKDLDASTLFSAELVEVIEAATDGLDEADKDLLKHHQKSCPSMLANQGLQESSPCQGLLLSQGGISCSCRIKRKEGQNIKAGTLL